MKIPHPFQVDPDLDQSVECHFAIEEAFRALRDQVIAVGWSTDDVAIALLEHASENAESVSLTRNRLSTAIRGTMRDDERDH